MYDVERMQVVHAVCNVLRIAHTQLPRQREIQIMYNFLERTTAYILQDQVQMSVLCEQHPIELDYVRMFQIAQDERFLEKRIVRLRVLVLVFNLLLVVGELELFDDHRFARVTMRYFFNICKKALADLLVEYELIQMVDLMWLLYELSGEVAEGPCAAYVYPGDIQVGLLLLLLFGLLMQDTNMSGCINDTVQVVVVAGLGGFLGGDRWWNVAWVV
jgi:hypothetical protein